MLWGWVSQLCLFLHPSLVTQTVAVEQLFITFSEFWAQSPNTNTKRGGFHDVSCFCSDFCSGMMIPPMASAQDRRAAERLFSTGP